ncbi:hypothetical protein HDG34_003098 [Paraburkholderia sp. HC6.4b]|uniref:inovirus-type Gp2 protein n=1 Tax=unclassified Paraburkholderia TaxID=2615204 RepID=UPI00162174A4|nr:MULTISPECIES: inovirus-type Gp2 protein [unclassified Paraburkholderia]MBB5409157.1 hypothetical protein [Paraburkholderia sp. HC6.4b]MBB5450885.1 hypothetical protein [Paraburkholderia sp. Kb1A]
MRTGKNGLGASFAGDTSLLQQAGNDGLRDHFFSFDRSLPVGARIRLKSENEMLEALGRIDRLAKRIRDGNDVRLVAKSHQATQGHFVPLTPDVLLVRTWLYLDLNQLEKVFDHHIVNPVLEEILSRNTELARYGFYLGNKWLSMGPPMEVIDDINKSLTALKSVLSDKDFKTREHYFIRASTKNLKSLQRYISNLLSHHKSMQYIRIDLGYHDTTDWVHRSSFREVHKLAKKHYDRLISLLKHDFDTAMPGHVRKIEYSSGAGYHFHCLFFFSQAISVDLQDVGERIGAYWSGRATQGCGAYFVWTTPAPTVWRQGPQHMQTSQDLHDALQYLTKLDRFLRLSVGGVRTLVTGKKR